MAYTHEWEVVQEMCSRERGKGPGRNVCPVHWRGTGVAAGLEPVCKLHLVIRKIIWARGASVSGKKICL